MRVLIAVAVILTCDLSNAEEISDLYFKQRVQKVAADRAAKRKMRRPINSARAEKEKSETEKPIAPDDHGITEIGIERNFGWHSGPVYTFVVKSDGTFRFEGRAKVDHAGKWTGKVDRRAFNELAQFIRDANYMGMQDSYDTEASDVSPTYTMVVQDGKRHVIQDSYTGPKALTDIEKRIYALLDNAEWDEQQVDDRPGTRAE